MARYPFSERARSFVQDEGYSLGDLLGDSVFSRVRVRAVQRVKGCLVPEGIPDAAALDGTSATFELLSYPLARAIVAAVDDPYLRSRYAVGESKLLTQRLAHEDDASLRAVAVELGVAHEAGATEGVFARLHFIDYLRHQPGREPRWKLVNQALKRGMVALPRAQFARVCEEAFRERLASELDALERPGRTVQNAMGREVNEIGALVRAHRERFAGDHGGPVRTEAFPPCMVSIFEGIKNHVNVPHMGRFAIVSFLHTLGLSAEDILNFFSSVPDFDVNKSRYQIEHITGKIGATQYTPPSCSTMQTYGVCPLEARDDLCLNVIHHPLGYYRKRVRQLPRKPVQGAHTKEVSSVEASSGS